MDNTSVSDQIIAGYYDSNLYGAWVIDYNPPRMEFYAAFCLQGSWIVESDPYLGAHGRGWRTLLGVIRRGFGYEYRKAAGRSRKSWIDKNIRALLTDVMV